MASTIPKNWAPFAWYVVIASCNAIFYVALSMAIVRIGANPPLAGVLALFPVLAISYLGHKFKTFRSAGAHRVEAPRFVILSIVDFCIAGLVPYVGAYIRTPPVAAFVTLTTVIPLVNFLLMRFWIFQNASLKK